jgi:muramoyltetrapeptide carboxypeptidase LdcA involved in peptidoglycan recycling
MPRLRFCVDTLRARGYEVVLGSCLEGSGVVSGSPQQRAEELTNMLTDPTIRAVVPPWGGALAVELLTHLDFDALAAAAPTWFVGMSDISTLLLPVTTLTATATLHGQNLLDTPYRVPQPLASWTAVATSPAGAQITQGPSERHRMEGFDRWEDDPTVVDYTFDSTGGWRLLHPHGGSLTVHGRLIGGCIETLSVLAGTAYGDLDAFARSHAPDGLVLYLEAAGDDAASIARHLWRMRLSGWFDHANAVLFGRTRAPAFEDLDQQGAIRSALGDLDVPVVVDVDCGHVPPHLSLVNGAQVELSIDGSASALHQQLT